MARFVMLTALGDSSPVVALIHFHIIIVLRRWMLAQVRPVGIKGKSEHKRLAILSNLRTQISQIEQCKQVMGILIF